MRRKEVSHWHKVFNDAPPLWWNKITLQPLPLRSAFLAALISFILHQQWETSSVKLLRPPAGWVEQVKTGSRGRKWVGGWEGTWWKGKGGERLKKKRGKKPTKTGCALLCFCPIGQGPTLEPAATDDITVWDTTGMGWGLWLLFVTLATGPLVLGASVCANQCCAVIASPLSLNLPPILFYFLSLALPFPAPLRAVWKSKFFFFFILWYHFSLRKCWLIKNSKRSKSHVHVCVSPLYFCSVVLLLPFPTFSTSLLSPLLLSTLFSIHWSLS